MNSPCGSIVMRFDRRSVLFAGVTLLLAGQSGRSQSQPASKKPKIIPGQDPGGIAIAVIGPGVDYAAPVLAKRIARDGEGEPIGWDFIDNDNRPFARESRLVEVLADVADKARFVVVRTEPLHGNLRLPALGFVSRTPARIVLLAVPPADSAERADVEKAAGVLSGHLLIVPALAQQVAPDFAARNILVVADAAAGGKGERPDVVVERKLPLDDLHLAAAVSAAAQAAAILAREPVLGGAALKERLLAAAAPAAKSGHPPTLHSP